MRELRAVEMSDIDRLSELWAFCFSRGELWDPIPEDMLKNSEGFLIEEDGRICGSYGNILFDMHYDERIVPIGGVSAVATALADRGTGVAQELMRHCVNRTREIGRPASMLYAFSLSFYRALGYELTGRIHRYELPLRDIPPYKGKGVVRQVEAKPSDVFNDIYSRWVARYRGCFTRRPTMWERHFRTEGKTLRFAYLFEDDEGPQGFLQFRFNDPAWENGPTAPPEILRLRDFVALTPDAHRALLGILSRFDMQCEKVRWNGPADDYVLFEPYEGLETMLVDQPMMRVTDLPALLATPAMRPASPSPMRPASSPRRFGDPGVHADPVSGSSMRTASSPRRPADPGVHADPVSGSSMRPASSPRRFGDPGVPAETVSGTYTITVHDFDWAGGSQTHTVELDDGTVTLSSTKGLSPTKGDPGIVMSQRDFIRCWVGDPDAVALHKAGHIEVTDEEQFGVFCAHFPRAVFYCGDGF